MCSHVPRIHGANADKKMATALNVFIAANPLDMTMPDDKFQDVDRETIKSLLKPFILEMVAVYKGPIIEVYTDNYFDLQSAVGKAIGNSLRELFRPIRSWQLVTSKAELPELIPTEFTQQQTRRISLSVDASDEEHDDLRGTLARYLQQINLDQQKYFRRSTGMTSFKSFLNGGRLYKDHYVKIARALQQARVDLPLSVRSALQRNAAYCTDYGHPHNNPASVLDTSPAVTPTSNQNWLRGSSMRWNTGDENELVSIGLSDDFYTLSPGQ